MNRLLAQVRHAAGTVVGWGFETAGGPPPGLPVGSARPDPALDDRPVVVVVLLEADADAVARTAADLAAAVAVGGPRPLLLLDRPHFAVARRAGVVTDHVLSRADWERRYPGRSWDDHLAAELRRLRHDFRTRHVVRLPSGGTAALPPGELDRLLRPPPFRAPVRRWRRAVVRLERRVDRGSG